MHSIYYHHKIQRTIHQIETDLHATIEPEINAGIIIHIAFLVNNLLNGEKSRQFKDLEKFSKKNRLDMDILRTNFMSIEKNYQISIPEDEIAFLVQMIQENRLDNQLENAKNHSV